MGLLLLEKKTRVIIWAYNYLMIYDEFSIISQRICPIKICISWIRCVTLVGIFILISAGKTILALYGSTSGLISWIMGIFRSTTLLVFVAANAYMEKKKSNFSIVILKKNLKLIHPLAMILEPRKMWQVQILMIAMICVAF